MAPFDCGGVPEYTCRATHEFGRMHQRDISSCNPPAGDGGGQSGHPAQEELGRVHEWTVAAHSSSCLDTVLLLKPSITSSFPSRSLIARSSAPVGRPSLSHRSRPLSQI